MIENNNIKSFLDDSGRIKQLPKKKKVKEAILFYLAEKFDINHNYTEKEVNALCDQWHTFGDFFLLRRELIDRGLLCRESDGTRYWKPQKEMSHAEQ